MVWVLTCPVLRTAFAGGIRRFGAASLLDWALHGPLAHAVPKRVAHLGESLPLLADALSFPLVLLPLARLVRGLGSEYQPSSTPASGYGESLKVRPAPARHSVRTSLKAGGGLFSAVAGLSLVFCPGHFD